MIPIPQLPAIPSLNNYVAARNFLFEVLNKFSQRAVQDDFALATTAPLNLQTKSGGLANLQKAPVVFGLDVPLLQKYGGTGTAGALTGYLKGNGTGAFTAQAVPIPVADGGTGTTLPRVLFVQTVTSTVTNTAAETSLVGTGVGTVALPANALVAGRTVRVTVAGSIVSNLGHTMVWRFRIGSTTFDSNAAGPATMNSVASDYTAQAIFTCRTTGVGGTGIGVSNIRIGYGANPIQISAGSITIDTTGTLALDVTAQWGAADAGDSVSATNVLIEIL